ncbi:amidohydrolase [Marinihelvus fidelis]|uniref:Amidohydrolase n=1 Tax=Marinihelvus fidelis TaxID=2613842 RepID=A0A5N0T817_9GAMM|nr:amidohydrolase [Marinihelvus fidelis]KAA9130868.1 amidohydrolase [Marinihelvus fidelis]
MLEPLMRFIVFLAALATVFPVVNAQEIESGIDTAAAEVQPQVVEWRRWFHQNPELSNREQGTGQRIAEILDELGIPHETGIAGYGVVGMIRGGKPGPLVAIRADMDGLPVTEQTGLPFASTVTTEFNGQQTGVMHACGHDNHMAMALGAAKILNDNREDLAGSVMLIFQPAEEGPPPGEPGGSLLMLEEGIFDEATPEAVFGIHVGIGVPGGEFATRSGPLMASANRFLITVHGKQTHGARPWDGIDPITVAAQIIMGLQTVASRQVDVTRAPSIVSVGRIDGGIRNNVIPDTVELEGTIRAFDNEMREQIIEAVERTATSIAAASNATIDFEVDRGAPPVVNTDRLYTMMKPVLERASGAPVASVTPQTVAEDFSEFGQVTDSLFVFLGSGPEGVDPTTLPANHSPEFNMEEEWLETGVKAFVDMVVTYLGDE